MKPRIRKTTVMRGYWLCLTSPADWYKGGVGTSPKEAYDNWARQNGINTD